MLISIFMVKSFFAHQENREPYDGYPDPYSDDIGFLVIQFQNVFFLLLLTFRIYFFILQNGRIRFKLQLNQFPRKNIYSKMLIFLTLKYEWTPPPLIICMRYIPEGQCDFGNFLPIILIQQRILLCNPILFYTFLFLWLGIVVIKDAD